MNQKKEKKQAIPEERYNFFLKLHKSILSADFYRSITEFSAKSAILFVVQLCLLTAVISGSAFAYYALDMKKGLPAAIPEMLPGMSLKNATLQPGRSTPFVPLKSNVAKVFGSLFPMPGIIDDAPESLVVVDTAALKPLDKTSPSRVILTSKNLVIQLNSSSPVRLTYPYSKWIRGTETVEFTSEGIQRFLVSNIVAVCLNFWVQSGCINAAVFFMSILFLGFAACIFRIDRKKTLGKCFKMACFAISPMFIGINIIALSGTQFPISGHLMLIASTVVLVRGINAERRALSANDKSR